MMKPLVELKQHSVEYLKNRIAEDYKSRVLFDAGTRMINQANMSKRLFKFLDERKLFELKNNTIQRQERRVTNGCTDN